MSCRAAIAIVLSGVTAVAQSAAERLPTFVEIGRTTARGGDCKRIVIAPDGAHMLTVGDCGDLLWWDLPKRRLLRRIEGKGRYVSALALHPTEPWAVVGACPGGAWEGFAWRCDLDTGETRVLWSDYTTDLGFDGTGRQLHARLRITDQQHRAVAYRSASLRGEQALEPIEDAEPLAIGTTYRSRDLRSPDGRHRVQWDDKKLVRTAPERCEYPLGHHGETWFAHGAVANDGTIVAADIQGQLHVQGLAEGDRAVLSGHAGDAHRLEFSPDGRFLAMVGLGACRIVDLQGKDVAEWWGTRIVLPGPEGADFWSFGRHELRRWSASTQRDVLPPRCWGAPALCLLRSSGQSSWEALRAGGCFHVHTLGAAGVVNDAPWLGADEMYGGHPWRFVDGAFQRFGRGGWSDPIAFVPRADGKVLHVSGSEGCADLQRSAWSYVHVFDGTAKELAFWSERGFPRWVAADADSQEVVLGLSDDTVHALAADTLATLAKRVFAPPLAHATVFARGRILAAVGAELLLLDARTLETVGTRSLPEDLGRIDAIAVSRQSRHLAVAHGSDVRIVRID